MAAHHREHVESVLEDLLVDHSTVDLDKPLLIGNIKYVPLVHAIGHNLLKIVTNLLEKGVNPNIFGSFELTPLMSASYHGNIEIIKLLLKYNANIDLQNRFGETVLLRACAMPRYDVVDILLFYGANIHLKNKYGLTAIDVMNNKLPCTRYKLMQIFEKYGKLVTSKETLPLEFIPISQQIHEDTTKETLPLEFIPISQQIHEDTTKETLPLDSIPISQQIYKEETCIVCLDNNSHVVYTPCGHQCVCKQCHTDIVMDKCPMCRVEIDKIFL